MISSLGNMDSGMARLNPYNYATWKTQMKMRLLEKQVWSAVVPLTEGVEDSSTGTDNMKALGLIGSAVEPALVSHIAHVESARDAWNVLQSVFQMSGAARGASLRRELHAMKLKAGQAINEYVAEAVRLRNEFIIAGISIDAQELNQALFAGLPGEYAIAEHMALVGGAQALESILPSLLLAEASINLKSEPRSAGEHGHGVALMAPSRQPRRQRRRLTCFRCQSEEHLIRECPHPPTTGAPYSSTHGTSHARLSLEPDAAIGSRNGEVVLACRVAVTRSYADVCAGRMAQSGRVAEEPAATSAFRAGNFTDAFHLDDQAKRCGFIIDSGATSHMTPNLELLCKTAPCEKNILVADGRRLTASLEGSVILGDGVRLDRVLYVKDLEASLLSVRQVVASGASVSFNEDACVISKGGRTVLTGTRSKLDGLYRVRETRKAFAASMTADKHWLWHGRFCHPSPSALQKTMSMVDGVDAEIVGEKVSMQESCTACLESKHSRRVFPATGTRAQAPLDLIHTDICGPISPPAHDGSKYFITFYDDATRLSVAQPIKNKDESFAVLTRTLKYLERQSGRKVRRIRSDNGGEFVSRKMEEWFADNGIAHELAPPYTPQMNGRAERLNRTLLEKLRTVLRASGMGKQLWNEALLAVNHARNRTAVDDLTCTPWQAFFGRRPDVSHLKVFGAKCIVLDTQAEKLDPRGKAGRIVGYGTRPHVYRVHLNEGIVVSTNVRVVSENGDPMQTTMGQVDCEDEDQDIPLDDEEASTESSIATVESGGVPTPSTPQDDSLGIVRNRVRGWQTETPSAFIKSTRSGRDIRMPTRYRADLCFLTQLVIDPDMLASKEAISARHRELETIKRFKTWEPTQVMEKREAEKIPGALFVRVKFVHALKNSELDGQAEWKARLVAQGCVVRDATGRNVKDELEFPYVAPASLLAVKSNLVLARALGHDAGIFDFEAAYLGARLTGPPIFLILPREAWDLDWATLNQPVVPCLKALYGLPASGSVYQVDAMRKMSARGWNAMETEMNTFYREINGHKLSLTLYVDDGIVTGPRKEICEVLDELRSDFSITKPVCFINAATKEVPARFLGMNLFLENNKLMLENSTYAKLILARYVEYCFSTKPRKVTTPTVDTETIKKLIDEGAASGGETAPAQVGNVKQ